MSIFLRLWLGLRPSENSIQSHKVSYCNAIKLLNFINYVHIFSFYFTYLSFSLLFINGCFLLFTFWLFYKFDSHSVSTQIVEHEIFRAVTSLDSVYLEPPLSTGFDSTKILHLPVNKFLRVAPRIHSHGNAVTASCTLGTIAK